MKPIETVYHGNRFRSRLEARWAVAFDALDVEYEYEPIGFELKDGTKYLPDFRVKCYGVRGGHSLKEPFDLYIEVKGRMTEEDAHKIKLFEEPLLIVSGIPVEGCAADSFSNHAYDGMDGTDICPFNYMTIDGDYFAAYPAATRDGRFYLFGDDSSYIDSEDLDWVERAYDIARKARFEYGDTAAKRMTNDMRYERWYKNNEPKR